jgi:hypothetical protein
VVSKIDFFAEMGEEQRANMMAFLKPAHFTDGKGPPKGR